MKLLWVAADKLGSRLIRWGLDSDCSHFAVSFDEDEFSPSDVCGKGIVFHSYGTGTQVAMLRDFLANYTIVHALELMQPVDEEAVYQAILRDEADRGYDYPALAWFTWRGLLAKIGWRRVDGVNRWQDPHLRLCTGIAPTVFKALGVAFPDVDPELTPPHDLYRLACDSGAFRACPDWVAEANLV